MTAKKAQRTAIMDKATVMIVTVDSLGNRRSVSSDEVEVDADKKSIAVSKLLLKSKEMKLIKSLDSKMRRRLQELALPSPFKNGIYLIAKPLMVATDKELQEYGEKRDSLVDGFITSYPRLIREAKARLRGIFSARDYPSPAEAKEAFNIDWQYVNFGVPDLSDVSQEIFEREKDKAEKKWAEASDAIQQVLRAKLLDLTNHLSEVLAGTRKGGKPQIFRDTSVTKINAFLDTFDARNITGDAELEKLVGKARKLVSGVDPDQLRKEEALRDSVGRGFDAIKKSLETMVVDKPKRKFKMA